MHAAQLFANMYYICMPKVKLGQQANVSLLHAQLDRLEMAFEKVRQMLSGRLHDFIRKQIVERADPS